MLFKTFYKIGLLILVLLAAIPASAQTPLVSWNFDEASGDATGTGTSPFALQLANGATRTTGITGQANDRAIDFGTNTSAKLTATAAASAALNSLSAITICAWVKVSPAKNPGWYYPDTTIYDRTASTSGVNLSLYNLSEGGMYYRYAPNSSSSWTVKGTSRFADVLQIYDNGWVFVAATLSGGTATFYSGTQLGSDFVTAGVGQTSGSATTFTTPSGATLNIGGSFSGLVDNFRIYSSALTQAQVKAIYDGDAATIPAPTLAPSDLATLRMGNIGANGVSTRGDTVPGVRLPFGSSYASPDTNNGYPSGYSNAKGIWGFSQLHVSGTGGDGKYGQFRMVPFKDVSGSTAAIRTIPNDSEYGASLEKLAVDAYEANLAQNSAEKIKVEMTPSHHGAKYRLTSLTSAADVTHILLDAGYSIPNFVIEWNPERQRGAKTGAFTIDAANKTMTGWGTYAGGWLGSVAGQPRWDTTGITDCTVYFAAKFSKAPVGNGTFLDKNPVLDGTIGRRTLTVGNKYIILDYKNYPAVDSFTNVGASSNASGVVFTATGTTPSAWSTNGAASTLNQVWTSGTLVVGKRYRIYTRNGSDSFTNVGAAANTAGTEFVATGTTPSTWTSGSVLGIAPWSNAIIPGGTSVDTASISSGDRFGGYLSFATAPGEQITMDIAVSFTSVAQAQSYLASELDGKSYDTVKTAARAAWDAKFNKITVAGGTNTQRRIFYTGLYRAMNSVADRTGDMPGLTASEPLYDDHYATWDTWRTVFPLLALIDEPVSRDNIRAFINRWNNLHAPGKPLASQTLADAYIGGKSGYNWASRQKQGGDGPDFIMQDAFLKGVPGVDYQAVLTAMRHSATIDDGNREMMGNSDAAPAQTDGMRDPADFRWDNTRPANGGGMSQMLEYQFNDFGLALVERGIGSSANQTTYANRSRFWENYFNYNANNGGRWTDAVSAGGDGTVYKGFTVPRNYDKNTGTWTTWADTSSPPVQAWDGTQLSGASQSGYYEGNGAIYTNFVPHDMKSLIYLTRNSDSDTFAQRQATFSNRINAMMRFDRDHPSANDFSRILNVGNEPSFLVLRQLIYAGRPDLASYWIRYVMDNQYSLREFPGDEDSGAMGSMYVWSALGLFPNAGTDIYLLNGPCFTQATLQVPGGTLTINGTNASTSNIYVQSATLNGQPLNRAWLRHSEIANGGTLTFVMGSSPSTWGQSEPPPMGRTFADWSVVYPSAGAANADPDSDGLNNFLEYALATNPGVSTPAAEKPTQGTTTVNGTTYKTISYNPSVAAISVTYTVEVSADGNTWTSGSGVTTLVRTGSPVIVRDNTAFSGSRRIRLKVADGTNTATYEPQGTTFNLTVNNGTGSGVFTPGTVTNILANTPPAGQVFNGWTGATSGIADVNAPSTTLTMPSGDTAITATFASGTQSTFSFNAGTGSISVNGGTATTGSGNTTIAPGYPVNLVATPAAGQTFVAWTGSSADLVLLSSTTSATTSFTMPARTVALTATYHTQMATVANPTFSPAGGTYSSTQNVTISTTTNGATIRYTTDGSTPTSSTGTVYSNSIQISANTTLKAIAYQSGMNDSSVVSADYTINQPAVASLTFSPVAGSYSGTQTITLSTSTSGATIRYTTDGSTPTNSSGTVYSGPFSLSASATVKAIAYKSGQPDSSVSSAAYTITYPITVLDDSFADGNRSGQALPTSAAWYLRSANPPGSSTSTAGTLVTPVTNANPGYTLVAYFPNRTLGVGESITSSITVNAQAFNQLPTASRSQFRFGLFNSGTNSGDRFTADASNTTINAGSVPNGNFVNINLLSGSFSNATATFFWNRTNSGADATSTSLFGAFVSNQGGERQGSPIAPFASLAGTNVVLSYTITNLDGTNATYDFKINGTTWTSYTGTLTGTGTVFNTLAFQMLGDTASPFGSTLGTSQTFKNLKVTATTTQAPAAATYYVTPTGSDANDGLSTASPWQTVTKVNSLALTPGTQVYFQGGQTFTDAGLKLSAGDGGSAANRVVIGSYGSGRALIKPPATDHGCEIYNVAGITVQNLIFEGVGLNSSTKKGVQVYSDLSANTRLAGLTFTNCEFRQFQTGFELGAYPADNSFSGFDNVLIDTCVAHDCLREGFKTYGMYPGSATQQSHTDLTFRDCEAYGITGDANKTGGSGSGIVLSGVKGGLIERCYAHGNGGLSASTSGGYSYGIWMWGCDSVVIQNSLVHDQRVKAGLYDGGGFDIDGGATNCTIQYCYSYNNDGPGYLSAQFDNAPVFNNNTFRYNISWRDGRYQGQGMASGFHFWSGTGPNPLQNVNIYNNVVYTEAATGGAAVVYQSGTMSGLRLRNNVFVVQGGARFTTINDDTARSYYTFQGNAYWPVDNNWTGGWRWGNNATFATLAAWRAASGTPETAGGSPAGFAVDPQLASVVAGAQPTSAAALPSITAFKLQPTSPLINAGLDLSTPAYGSLNVGTRDFFGTATPQNGAYDVGAHEYTFTPFQNWLSSYGLPADGSGAGADLADPDGDGAPNLLEYALGGDPTVPSNSNLPVVSLVSGRLQIAYSCSASLSDITYTVQSSPDLAAWSDIAQSVGGVTTAAINSSGAAITDSGNGVRTVTVTDTSALSAKRFIRLKITRP